MGVFCPVSVIYSPIALHDESSILVFFLFLGHNLIFLLRFGFFFGILQPFDELLHLLQEVHLALV